MGAKKKARACQNILIPNHHGACWILIGCHLGLSTVIMIKFLNIVQNDMNCHTE